MKGYNELNISRQYTLNSSRLNPKAHQFEM